MNLDGRATFLFRLQRGYGRHVAADAVADDSQVFSVHLDLLAMLSYPTSGGVDFVDGLWIAGIRRARIIDEDSGKAGQNDEVTHHPFVRRVIAQHPAAAVDED